MGATPYFYRQTNRSDCGPTALRIVLSVFKKHIQLWDITEKVPCYSSGWSVEEFCHASSFFGLKTTTYKINTDALNKIELPIVLLFKEHYVVCYYIKNDNYFIADPQRGKLKFKKKELIEWMETEQIIAIKCDTTPNFESIKSNRDSTIQAFCILSEYFIPYKQNALKLLLIILIVCIAQLFIPFIARAIIDKGVTTSSFDFLLLLLIGNAALILTTILGNFTQTYLVTHITNRVKVTMLNQYIEKVLHLPVQYFSQSNIGDLVQRVRDSERIQSYIVTTFFSSIVAFLFLIIFSIVLLYFSTILFWVTLVCSISYIGWTCLFLKERKKIDLNFWELQSACNKHIIDIQRCIFDIKIFGLDTKFGNKWRNIIVAQHKQNIRYLKFSQMQDIGANIISQGKDIALTYIACYLVLHGEMTLGSLFAIQYVLGMISSPLTKLAFFLDQTQLTIISLHRIITFNRQEEEVSKEKESLSFIPFFNSLQLENISFKYPSGTIALRNVSLRMQLGQKISIVGQSGCGKSTILKILCGLLNSNSGEYYIGTSNSKAINWQILRKKSFSALLQENTLMDGSILDNIIGDSDFDETRFIHAVEIASIRREIEMMPNGYHTIIGSGQRKLSNGQKQRLLIARTLYKEADIYLFDEIANGLSTNFENKIINKIDMYRKKALRVYISHRGDALIDSDMIVVLEKGHIVDYGTHDELLKRRSYYSSLFSTPNPCSYDN